MRAASILLLVLAAAPATAQTLPDYRDDRSTPEAVVQSLYNAIERKELARAWSYFEGDAAKPFAEFAAGYDTTRHVRVRLFTPSSEGAAGSIFSSVPTVVEAVSDAGTSVFAGCYELRLVQPAAQIEPPFRPLAITKGSLAEVRDTFDAAKGHCTGEGTE
ncbi:hypothetical protein [Aureimonas sp. ME7]|uniref:hypothetical protein n=1 Tax=Aureimonas sp. ME7 TaxID=2744252 RepID=UPI0015F3532B|nr:hypothetical protein [Aureimonas sp. ME7]